MAENAANGLSEGSGGRYVAGEFVELRLPSKAEYLPVLRATVAVVAGSMSFNYDEVLQLRVAVSEAFGLAVRHIPRADARGKTADVKARFVIGEDGLEVIVTCPRMERGDIESAEDVESRVVIESLVDSVAIDAETSDERVIRLFKNKTVAGG